MVSEVHPQNVYFSLKACVRCFFIKWLFFTKWQPFKNYEKCFLFHYKNSFCSRDIQIFVFSSAPLFSLSATASEVDPRKILTFMTSLTV